MLHMTPQAVEVVEVDAKLAALERTGSIEAEQFQRLRYKIEEMRATEDVRVVAVTSAVTRDGKTMVAVNLAAALARNREARTLLVDADLRRPSVAATLGLPVSDRGLLAALDEGAHDLDPFIRRIAGTRLDVLTCEPRHADVYDALSSTVFRLLVARARSRYHTVVIDAPPVIPVPDSSLLGPSVDGYLVVVSADATPRKLVGETLTMLEPTRVLGIVFNRDRRPFFGYAKSYHAYFDRPQPASQ